MTNPTPVTGRKVTRADFNNLGAAVAALEATPPVFGDAASLLAFDQNADTVSIPFVTPQMFGAVADNVTDDGPAFAAALAHLKTNATSPVGYSIGANRLFVPKGRYYLGTTTLDLDFACMITGEGGYSAGCSILRWAANTTGIRAQAYNTSGASTVDGATHYGASGSTIENLLLQGAYSGTEGEHHGIHMKNPITVRNVAIFSFQGDGIHIAATAGSGGALEGNSNCFQIDRIFTQWCRNGLYVDGADANAGLVTMFNGNANRQWGIYDSSFLGNTYVGCHTASNGWEGGQGIAPPTATSYGGNRYAVIPGQEAWCSLNPPSGTTAHNQGWRYLSAGGDYGAGVPLWESGLPFRAGGAYFSDDPNAASVFLGCYSEGDQNPAFIGAPAMVIGGLHGAGIVGVSGFSCGPEGWPRSLGFTAENGVIESKLKHDGVRFGPQGLGFQTFNNGVEYIWTVAESGVPSNHAMVWCGTGTTRAIGARRFDFPNGYGMGGTLKNLVGAGTPEGAVSAAPGSTYQRTDGGAGTSFYVKETGTGNTGWAAK